MGKYYVFIPLLLGLIVGGCENKIDRPNAIYGKRGKILPKTLGIKAMRQSDNVEWLSRKTESGIEWYPAKITYDKQGHMIVIPLKQKTIPRTTGKIERHCQSNDIGDITCELIKTVYDKKGNILKRVILQRQRAIHRPLPGHKAIKIKTQRKNKN